MKSRKDLNNQNNFIRFTGLLMLVIFVNFTFVVQYVNLSGTGMSLTELVEEEEQEQEEHNINLHELMLHSSLLFRTSTSIQAEQILSIHHSEVLTPPPKKA